MQWAARFPASRFRTLAYVAANCHTVLAKRPDVDPERIGIVGHSYGGKWTMFASCLYDKFACAVWCDPGIVFDEKQPQRQLLGAVVPGLRTGRRAASRASRREDNPRTGLYKKLVETAAT